MLSTERVTPSKQKDPTKFKVTMSLPSTDGVAGATVVVAPGDDERNLLSDKAAKAFVAGREKAIKGTVTINPGIYRWWRFCWFPHTYRVTGRIVHHEATAHTRSAAPTSSCSTSTTAGGGTARILSRPARTDPDGLDISFTWCVPSRVFVHWRPPIM